jgi:hypothetical protein
MPTAWRYAVPYQPDLQRALDELRTETFRRGAYLQAWRIDRPGQEPAGISDALAFAGPEGTHSVLDVDRVALIRGPGRVWLAPPALRVQVFGALEPTTAAVEQRRFGLVHGLDVGEGAVVIVYSPTGQPQQLLFEGLSGGDGRTAPPR